MVTDIGKFVPAHGAGHAAGRLRRLPLFKNTRLVEMSKQRPGLAKDRGELVVELDLRGNMDASTIREILETNQVPGVNRVALGE
jgi:hypothetical protein